MKLSTDHQVYRRGEPVVITLTETNTSQHAITVEQGPSMVGITVNHNGREVWASNRGIQPMFVALQDAGPWSVDHGDDNMDRPVERRV